VTGGPINPAKNKYLHKRGPNRLVDWLIDWDTISDQLFFFVELTAFILASGGNPQVAFTIPTFVS